MGYGIVTRYLGPTDHRGSRIVATGPSVSSGTRPVRAVRGYDHAADGWREAHRPAATAVLESLRAAGWRVALGDPVTLPDDSGLVWPLRNDGGAA